MGDVSKLIPVDSSLSSNDEFLLGVYYIHQDEFHAPASGRNITKAKCSQFVIYSEVL